MEGLLPINATRLVSCDDAKEIMVSCTWLRPARTLLAWSSGNDSGYTLSILLEMPEVVAAGLLTAFNGCADRVSM